MRLEPYPIDYNITLSLWNKPISTKNPLAAAILKVCHVVGAVFAAMYETLRNLSRLIANQFIERHPYAKILKHGRVFTCLANTLGDDAPESLRKLAGALTGKTRVATSITITREEHKAIMNGLEKRNLTMKDIERMSVAVQI